MNRVIKAVNARAARRHQFDAAAVLAAIPDPIVVVTADNIIEYANAAAEHFFETSVVTLVGTSLKEIFPVDNPLFLLVETVHKNHGSVSEHGVTLQTPRMGPHQCTIRVASVTEDSASLVITFHERSMEQKIDRQLTHRNAARSVTAMAAMLAHEVKNPLSGIRGAAQLLEETVSIAERELTQLICDESDRIVSLVNRMEAFSDRRPLERGAVNIHEVLGRVRLAAQAGFARNVRFIENYDPSLPPAFGNRDSLIQVFLNLIKNAAEAVPASGGEILLLTGYQHGVRLAAPGCDSKVHLPLVVSVVDNGEGIPLELRAHLFDPFVSTKHKGTGLGLALVAKVIDDHGGVIEFDSEPGRTVFRVCLPVTTGETTG